MTNLQYELNQINLSGIKNFTNDFCSSSYFEKLKVKRDKNLINMTCIVGIIDKEKNRILIGGDSAGSGANVIITRKDPKVFKNKNFIIGFTTSFRMGQILMTENLSSRAQYKSEDDFTYIVKIVIKRIRKLFIDGGYSCEDEEMGGDFILGYKNKIYLIHSDFQVGEYHEDYMSCGCGEPYALGSLYTTENTLFSASDRLIKALEAAEKFALGVRGPFNIVELKY
jgi:ATP-dependent protease HslVU (ClpYQ) peptidase subunit